MKKILRFSGRLFCLLLILTTMSACPQEESLPLNHSYDVLQELQTLFVEETQSIEFKEGGNSESHLLHGWIFPAGTHTWAVGKKSRLRFYRYNLHDDVTLELFCTTLPSPDAREQLTELELNGKTVTSFVVRAAQQNRISLTLPADSLQPGLNILEFRYSYTVNSRELNPDAGFELEFAVNFERILFKSPHAATLQVIEHKKLLQKTGAQCSLLLTLPPGQFELELEYQSLTGANSGVRFLNDKNEVVRELKLPSRKQRHLRRLTLPEGGLYRLQFITEGKPDSYTVWSLAHINWHQEALLSRESGAQGFTKSEKPDILLYVVDTLRADHMSCYGYARETTPNIDRFAAENILFRNAYSAASWTRASAATILSGLLPKHNKTETLDDKLPNEIMTLAEILQENGYYTASFVTNVNLSKSLGFAQGFLKQKEFFNIEQPMTSDKLNEKIVTFLDDYLKEKDRKPLFLLVWSMDPHAPYAPLDNVKHLFDIERYSPIDTYDFKFVEHLWRGTIRPTTSQIEFIKTRYDQEIYFNDRSFGGLMDVMKTSGIYDDALIILTADHGEEFYEHSGVGHGRTLYNEQIRIPLVLKTPLIESEERHEPVQLIDIYPTILDLLGIQEPYPLDGISLRPTNTLQRNLYFQNEFGGNSSDALLDREKKIIFNAHSYRPPLNQDVPTIEIFDIHDMSEQNTLKLKGLEDEFRLQQLFSFKNRECSSEVKQVTAEISEELDRKLKDLGYVK